MKSLLATILLVAACGSNVPSQELVSARAAYDRASRSNAAKLAPAELHAARRALDSAELESSDHASSTLARDLSYIAQRRAQRAEAIGNTIASHATAVALDAQRTRAQDAVIAAQQGRLRATQGALERQQSELSRQGSELERKSADLSAQQAQTAAERQARVDAEAKIAEAERKALDAMDALSRELAVKDDTRGTVITLSGSVLFVTGKSTLLPGATAQLDKVAEALTQLPERHFTIEGHTDTTGSYAVNADLSARRANVVRDYLISRGVSATAVSAVGIGSERPVADNQTVAGRAMNRRVEIVVDRPTSPRASAGR